MFPAETEYLEVKPRIRISCSEFVWAVARSSGPGGQNVNKVNSKVVLRWPLSVSQGLPDDIRDRFVAAFRRKINAEGEFILTSERFRDQLKNVGDCLEKLKEMLASVAVAPKTRRVSKPTRASKQRRVAAKRQRTEVKLLRQRPVTD